MEITTVMAPADKMTMIDTGVEVVNKLLYTFMIDQNLFDQVDQELNNRYRKLQPDLDSIDGMFFFLLSVVQEVEQKTNEWVKRHRVS